MKTYWQRLTHSFRKIRTFFTRDPKRHATATSKILPHDSHPNTKIPSGLAIFFKEILKHPRRIGAALPSSRALTEQIAKMIPQPQEGLIIELGGGTGVITQALLSKGIPPNALWVVEQSENLVHYLRERFPNIKIIHGDASNLAHFLPEGSQVHAIVSGLPLRSFSKTKTHAIGKMLEAVLDTKGYFVQFTYSFDKKYLFLSQHLEHLNSKYVWLNFPPARVDLLKIRANKKSPGEIQR